MSFLPPLEMRPSSIAPNPVESREAPPNCTVSLTSPGPDLIRSQFRCRVRTGESGLVLCGGMELCLPLQLFTG